MAKRVVLVVVDDLDGEEIPEGEVRPFTCSLDGHEYSLDLRQANFDRLRQALAPFIGETASSGGPVTRVELPPAEPEKPRHKAVKAPSAPVDGLPVVTPRAPKKVLKPQHTIVPGVLVVTQEHEIRDTDVLSAAPSEDVVRDFDWDSVDLEATALQLRDRFADGLPEAIRFTYKPEVLSIEGMNLESVESALRNPERVEVAPETFVKGYPVLRFHRGDVLTVLGLRTPATPRIIAGYHTGLLLNDWHRTEHSGRGGGARREAGLPSTPRACIKRLREQGAVIDWDPASTVTAVAVQYHGQDLGKVSVGAVTKDQVQSDYQRTIRKMEAISRREA